MAAWTASGVRFTAPRFRGGGASAFIGFPDEPTPQNLPSWAKELKTDFADYITSISHGSQTLDLHIIKRTDESTKAWIADTTAAGYNGASGTLNTEIMNKIHEAYLPVLQDSIREGVEQVSIYHYTHVWSNNGIGGYGGLSVGTVPGFEGGLTIRFPQADVDGIPNKTWTEYATGHEYGQHLGYYTHTPNMNLSRYVPGVGWVPNERYVNMGRYDCMRANGGNNVSVQGFLPYHPKLLADYLGWPNIVEVTSDVLGLHIRPCWIDSPSIVRRA